MDKLSAALRRRQSDRLRELMFVGWHVAAFQRAKTIPDLSRWIADVIPSLAPKRQTMDEQIGVAKQIVALWSPRPVKA